MLNFSNQQQITPRFWTESPLKLGGKIYLSYLFQGWKVSSDLHLVSVLVLPWPQRQRHGRGIFSVTVCTTCFGSTCWHETATMKVDAVCVAVSWLLQWYLHGYCFAGNYDIPPLFLKRIIIVLIILGGDMLLSSVIGRKSMISSCTSPFKTERNLTWIISKNIRLYPLSNLWLIL